MATAYHIDRQNKLSLNQEINLVEYDPKCQGSIQFQMNRFSAHGAKYADHYNSLHQSSNLVLDYWMFNDPQMESILEHLRVALFPNLPSRMQSIFCTPSLEEVTKWLSFLKVAKGTYSVWEIEYSSNRSAIADACFLKGNTLSEDLSKMGYENYVSYWAGFKSEDPLLELLIELPVKVVRRIT